MARNEYEDVYRERDKWRRKCVQLERQLELANKALELSGCQDKGVLRVSYAVEWRTTTKPHSWELYSSFTADPKQAQHSHEAALKNPCCLDARYVERMDLRREVDEYYMSTQVQVSYKNDLQMATPAECYGR